MPRPRAPPTPSSSTDLKALERNLQPSDMESSFALPPPALRSEAQSQTYSSKTTSNRGGTNTTVQRTPPVSPKDKPLTSSPRQKRTASGMVKSTSTEPISTGPNAASPSYALPPPPSRARKIIQMKPKAASSNNHPSPDSDASYQPPATSTTTSKASAAHSSTATNSNSKRKQPSATSAAGRKIARKTAHSIIERRRRSKMNEEFGVLKDMIPACEGVEMHKLAILQAGIEYVKYLEGCVAQLKAENQKQGQAGEQGPSMREESYRHSGKQNIYEQEDNDESGEDDEDEDNDMDDDEPAHEYPSKVKINYPNQPHASVANDEWAFRDSRKASLASQTSSANPSPYLHAHQQSQSDEQRLQQDKPLHQRAILPASTGSFSASPSQIPTHAQVTSSTPTPTMLSPAFNSIHFSPDLNRTHTNGSSSIGSTSVMNSGTLSSSTSIGSSWTPLNQAKPSPQMAPLPSPKASMHLPLPLLANNLQLPHPYPAGGRENSRSPAAMSDGSGTAEATATAALMMLTNDWRAGAGASVAVGGGSRDNFMTAGGGGSKDKGKGMSVRDLLSS